MAEPLLNVFLSVSKIVNTLLYVNKKGVIRIKPSRYQAGGRILGQLFSSGTAVDHSNTVGKLFNLYGMETD